MRNFLAVRTYLYCRFDFAVVSLLLLLPLLLLLLPESESESESEVAESSLSSGNSTFSSLLKHIIMTKMQQHNMLICTIYMQTCAKLVTKFRKGRDADYTHEKLSVCIRPQHNTSNEEQKLKLFLLLYIYHINQKTFSPLLKGTFYQQMYFIL